jgi:type VI secretion system protein ImpK
VTKEQHISRMVSGGRMHLIDSFMQLIAYVVIFQKDAIKAQQEFEPVKTDIQRLLAQSEVCVRSGHFSPEDYDLARFMVCAWIDEVILSSSWPQKNLWQREQLQRMYYNTTDAGVEAFERLNGLGFHQRDVREVYYHCLALGFKGRFIHPGDEYLLEQLKTSNLKILMGSSVGMPSLEKSDLFPEAFPAASVAIAPQQQKLRFSVVTVMAIAGPLVLFGLLYLVYYFTLSGLANKFV